jgi:hypothetical protein
VRSERLWNGDLYPVNSVGADTELWISDITGLWGLPFGSTIFLTPARIEPGFSFSKIGAIIGATAGSAKTGWACFNSFSCMAIVFENCSGEKKGVGA